LIFDVYGTMGVFKNCFCISQEFFRDHKAIVTQSFLIKNHTIRSQINQVTLKLIQRRAYGFRNFENYRLRVKVLCS
ncbi:TPA: transposase, partial [Legionella pneumophila]